MIYVVSAPRSGLNWLRFCVEHYFGVKTPGHDILVKGDKSHPPAFIRAHNARKGPNTRKGTSLGEITKAEDKVLLLLRDPLETFVRSADRRFRRFNNFVEIIRYFSSAPANAKLAAYYEDYTVNPAAMAKIFTFLDIAPSHGHSVPSVDKLKEDWTTLGTKSRETYDKQQAHGKGAMTKENPTDFSFHQRQLTEDEKQQVWRFLQRKLTPDQLKLLARYQPPQGVRKAGFATSIRDSFQFLR